MVEPWKRVLGQIYEFNWASRTWLEQRLSLEHNEERFFSWWDSVVFCFHSFYVSFLTIFDRTDVFVLYDVGSKVTIMKSWRDEDIRLLLMLGWRGSALYLNVSVCFSGPAGRELLSGDVQTGSAGGVSLRGARRVERTNCRGGACHNARLHHDIRNIL